MKTLHSLRACARRVCAIIANPTLTGARVLGGVRAFVANLTAHPAHAMHTMNDHHRAMRARTCARAAAPAAVAAPPPAPRGAVRGAFLAGLAGLVALLLAAAPDAAQAQAANTISLSVVGSATGPGITDGDRDSTADGLQVNEGDTITITLTLNSPNAGGVAATGCLDFMGTATPGTE